MQRLQSYYTPLVHTREWFGIGGALEGVALVEGHLLTLSGSHSEPGIESYSEKSFSASTRRVTP